MRCSPKKYFQISFLELPTDVLGCWLLLADYLDEQNAMPKKLWLAQPGHEPDIVTDAAGVATTIEAKGMTSFQVHTGYAKNHVSYILQHSMFNCGILGNIKTPNKWQSFIESVASRFIVIGGWQPYWPYHMWQFSRSPDDYTSGEWGTLPPGYEIWHEPDAHGIGPGQTFMDTSKNPGRTKIADNRSIFFPTAEMWLGPEFWPYAKCTKQEVLAADFFLEKRDTPHFLYLKCWPQPFTRPDGEQGHMQQRLWRLFFHEDCEWPPGSGGISDEPMYGPPELMPGASPEH